MGVIRKKTASRGTEAGTKFHCDVCSIDVTSTVSSRCYAPCSLLNGAVRVSRANARQLPRFASHVHIPPAPNTIFVSPVSRPE